jgi:REP element-mobilizing transposase RayT
MLPDEPLAYLLTWTLKGMRLHGDRRGSVDPQHNVFGEPLLGADPVRAAIESRQLKLTLKSLDARAREVVATTLQEVAARRGWTLVAHAARPTHIHVVVSAPGERPERVMSDFKAWATRRLREAGLIRRDARPWARHGSTRYLWKEQHVAAADAYVDEGQDVPR